MRLISYVGAPPVPQVLVALTQPYASTKIWTPSVKTMMVVFPLLCQGGHVRWGNISIKYLKVGDYIATLIFRLGPKLHHTLMGTQAFGRSPTTAGTQMENLGLGICHQVKSVFSPKNSRCYTTDPDVRWELCPDLTCAKGIDLNIFNLILMFIYSYFPGQ